MEVTEEYSASDTAISSGMTRPAKLKHHINGKENFGSSISHIVTVRDGYQQTYLLQEQERID
jgi:hypothetical protein